MAKTASSTLAANSEKVLRGKPAGHLVGVTATGPVYFASSQYVPLSLGAALATVQELALRVDHHDAKVSSSLAGRVSGQDAYEAWLSFVTQCCAQVAELSPRARLGFLHIILTYARSVGRIDGLEPILMTAVNAAWPWLSDEATEMTLRSASTWLRKSDFARKHAVSVIDPTTRTAGLFGPGAAAKLDLAEWRTSRSLFNGGLGGLPTDIGGKLGEIAKSPLEKAIDLLFGGSSSSMDDAGSLLAGTDNPGVPGGLPSAGDLPGQKGSKPGGKQSLDDIAAGLMGGNDAKGIPGGLADASSIPGAKSQAPSGGAKDKSAGLLGSVPGVGGYRGVSGFLHEHGSGGFKTGIFKGATPGGPFAPPGQLGINGEGGEDPETELAGAVATGGGLILTVSIATAAPAAAGAAATLPAAAIVAGVVVAAAVGFIIGWNLAKIVHDRPPPPPKKAPRDGDLYPDPWGDGGGNPTQLPDYDGSGEGNPTTLPGEDGTGGGTPNTIWGKTTEGVSIWDDNFGGPGPTVKPQMLTVKSLVGPGLLADYVQVGRTAIRY